MNALTKLQGLYDLKKNTDEQIATIEAVLGADPMQQKQRRPRGPNKKKEAPPEPVRLKEVPPRLPNAVI
jgi:hypothetical protein